MNEFVQYINEAYTKTSPSYGYFLIAFTMFNWEPLKGRKLDPQEITLVSSAYRPWRARQDIDNRDYNDRTFNEWFY